MITIFLNDLQNGDRGAALAHLNLAKGQLSSIENQSSPFKLVGILVNDTIEDLQDENIDAAFTHLNLARELRISNNTKTQNGTYYWYRPFLKSHTSDLIPLIGLAG